MKANNFIFNLHAQPLKLWDSSNFQNSTVNITISHRYTHIKDVLEKHIRSAYDGGADIKIRFCRS